MAEATYLLDTNILSDLIKHPAGTVAQRIATVGEDILLAPSTIRRVTEAHAQKIFETTRIDEAWPGEPGCETVVVEMDGGMVPTVEADTTQKDRRRGKKLQWKEAKL